MWPNPLYGLPHKRKKLTDRLAVGEVPAVVYPASRVGSSMSRADMESASPTRHTLQAAGKLPEELSASVGAGRTLVAMMVDQSRRKRGWVFKHRGLTKPHLVAQRGVANARQLVGQRTGGLVVVAAVLQLERQASEPHRSAPEK